MNCNIEHQLVEAESREIDDQCISELDSIDGTFDAQLIQDRLEAEAMAKAQKILKRNRKEIARLKTHAGNCVMNGNFAGYSYAIKKLRGFYKQPYNDELIKSMWDSTRAAVIDIAKDALEQEAKKLK